MLAALISAALLGGGPTEEVARFREAAAHLPPTVVFVSFLGVDGKPQVPALQAETMFNLTLNHVHLRNKKQFLKRLDGDDEFLDVEYIDYAELGWTVEQVKALIAKDPYFQQFQKPGEYLYIIRADSFIRLATFGRTYYELLFGVKAKKAADAYEILGIQRPDQSKAAALAFNGGRCEKSGVNRSGERIIKWLPGLIGEPGGGFETDDLAIDSKSGENVHESIHNLGVLQADAHEAFGLLPDGNFWYLVFDANDLLLDAAADNVAQDNRKYVPSDKLVNAVAERPSYLSMRIENSHICMGCHGAGTRPYECWVATRIQNQGVRFFGNKDRVRNSIEDFYDWLKQSRFLSALSRRYVEAIKESCGLEAAEAMAMFARKRWEWEERPLDLAQAASEVRVTQREFVQYVAMLKAYTPDSPGWKLRYRLARFYLEFKHDAKSAQAVLGLDAKEFAAFLKGDVPIKLGSNALDHLAAGGIVSRFQWEQLGVYTESASVICYQQQATKEATMQELNKLFAGESITVIEVPVVVPVPKPNPPPKAVEKTIPPPVPKTPEKPVVDPVKEALEKAKTKPPPVKGQRDKDVSTGKVIEFDGTAWKFIEEQQQ